MWAIWQKMIQELSYSYTVLPTWFTYQNTENVDLTEVPKLGVDVSDLALTLI